MHPMRYILHSDKREAMSHSDNTSKKFDANFPEWLAFKLWVQHVDPEDRRFNSRQAENRQWRREIEMEWRSA